MRNTLRVSPAGLAIVNQARREQGLTLSNLSSMVFISEASLRRFFQGGPIQRETFINICKALGIDHWEFIADISDLQSTVPRELSGTLSQPMDSEEMLAFIDDILLRKTGKHINNLQRIILFGAWNGKTYEEIAINNDYSRDHIKNSGSNLYRILSHVLGEQITKSNFRSTIERLRFSRKFFSTFSQGEDTDINVLLQELERLNASLIPADKESLSLDTWATIHRLYHVVVSEVLAIHQSASPSARSLALNRAQAELQTIRDNPKNIPQAERELILKIAHTWQNALLQLAGEVGNVTITEPVRSPYVIGNPVEGSLFVGREDILKQLEELWIEANRLQSVVLFGHRRMGKTSILRNVNACLGDGVKLAYVNMLNVGNAPQGVGEVLMAICDEIAEIINISPPADEDLLKLPYPTFRRFLQQVDKVLVESPQTPLQKGGLREESPQKSLEKGDLREGKGLIIALDEFEKIEDLINAGKIEPGFMGMLRTQVQASPRIAFAFAGLHTLEEMTEDYFQPFFASIIPIPVSFLSRGSTAQLLANPDEDFILDYQPNALDFIYDLTCGQPFLVQLVGFQLVRHYNQEMFETGKKRDPVFTVDDVEAVINDPEFYQRGRYYFTGVWGQAAQDVPGQQEILQILAPYKSGLPVEMVREITGLDEEVLLEAIKGLKRHDVVEEKAGNLRILVELFRLWVEKKPGFSGGK
ncbi:hypothetical protein [Planktothricoides raciborskii]|uniref:HTH cro/C1-type domain-containing protein n=1 Tax=Planktothricoides raciborskii GIHE-MW2 TaxID=2792601 RepID=A0AAU8JC73_9CYAN